MGAISLMATEFDSIIDILEDDLLDLSINEDQDNSLNELTILGFIISDKVVNFRVVKNILSTAWNLGDYVCITALDRNLIACSFQQKEDRNRILADGTWAVKVISLLLLTGPLLKLMKNWISRPLRFGSRSTIYLSIVSIRIMR